MDGTLIDTEKFFGEGWLTIADDFGLARNPKLHSAMSGKSREAMPEILKGFYPNISAKDAKAYIDKVFDLCERRCRESLETLPGVQDLLAYFQEKRVPMAVVSGSDRSKVEDKLKRTGIRKYFAAIVGGDEVEKGKPDPEGFLKAAAALEIPPADCYVFEDSFNGIRAGHAAGATAIMVPNQVQPDDEIRSLCTVCDSLSQALQLIREGKI